QRGSPWSPTGLKSLNALSNFWIDWGVNELDMGDGGQTRGPRAPATEWPARNADGRAYGSRVPGPRWRAPIACPGARGFRTPAAERLAGNAGRHAGHGGGGSNAATSGARARCEVLDPRLLRSRYKRWLSARRAQSVRRLREVAVCSQ